MMYAGYYAYDDKNGILVYGECQSHFKVLQMTIEHFKQQIDIDYDYIATNVKVELSDNHITTTKSVARNYCSYSNVRLNKMLERIYKLFKVDLSEYAAKYGYLYKVEYAYMYFQLAIKDRMQKLKTAIVKAKRKAELDKRKLEQIIYLNQLLLNAISDYLDEEYNFDNIDWHSYHALTTVKKVQTSIHISEAKQKGFSRVFPNSRFFIHNKTKMLWIEVGLFLVRLTPQDYLTED